MNKCPKCKTGELKESVTFQGNMFSGVKKGITTYCPVCGFKNTIILPSSVSEKQEHNMRSF